MITIWNKHQKKIRLFGLFGGILLLFTVTFQGIYSYFSDADSVVNPAQVGKVDHSIVESFSNPGETLEPGDDFMKKAAITNTGESSCFVRAKVVWSDDLVKEHCTLDWNTTDWVYNETDGYYYYKTKLQPKETTSYLFTYVSIDGEIETERLRTFDLSVLSDSVQTTRFLLDGTQLEYNTYQEAWADFE